jgi:hypothetical protein
MARVSEEEIQRLKREIALELLAAAAGVELKRHGSDLIGKSKAIWQIALHY